MGVVMKVFLAVLGFLLLNASAQGQSVSLDRLKDIQADPVALKAAIEAGKKASFFCANCHGEEGVSKTPDVPNLAGQHPAYLLEQIRKFAAGERKNQFMQGLIKLLKDEERVQLVLFYANEPVVPNRADAALATHGKALFDKLCTRCHGEKAHGSELYPRIAGQKVPYLQASITRYRDRTGVRNNVLMSIATASLNNDEIVSLANYLTQLP